MTGAELLVRELQARGVPFVSVLCGNGLAPFLSAAAEADLRIVDTRNEQAASYMADAYARLTRKVGVCAVSSGIAHVNAMAGLMNAWYDGTPMLLITGASATPTLGRGGFQDCDQVALARPLCKYVELVTRPERIAQAVHEAFAAATSGKPGPTHLTIPTDVLSAEVDGIATGEGTRGHKPIVSLGQTPSSARLTSNYRVGAVNIAAADEGLVGEAAEMIAQSARPVIVAGGGVFYAEGGEALLGFAHQARVPVVTPIWDRGVVNEPTEEFLGVIGAASGEPRLLEDADLLVLAGTAVDYRTRYLDSPPLRDDLKLVRIDVDPGQLHRGVEPDVALLGDPGTVFDQLAEAWTAAGYDEHAGWLAEAKQRHREFYSAWDQRPEAPTGAMVGFDLVQELRKAITDDTVFLVDGGNIGQWAHMMLCQDQYPEDLLTCGASGVVGWGVPGALAAKLVYPDRPVLLLSGDGSITFGIAEFQSAVRQGLPFVCVLANDSAWGIVVSGQREQGEPIVASELGGCDYVQVVTGFGGRAVRVESPEEIPQMVRAATLVEVPLAVLGPADCR